jgi:hypothetical protein
LYDSDESVKRGRNCGASRGLRRDDPFSLHT